MATGRPRRSHTTGFRLASREGRATTHLDASHRVGIEWTRSSLVELPEAGIDVRAELRDASLLFAIVGLQQPQRCTDNFARRGVATGSHSLLHKFLELRGE